MALCRCVSQVPKHSLKKLFICPPSVKQIPTKYQWLFFNNGALHPPIKILTIKFEASTYGNRNRIVMYGKAKTIARNNLSFGVLSGNISCCSLCFQQILFFLMTAKYL